MQTLVGISRTLPACTYTTGKVSEAVTIAQLLNHGLSHQSCQSPAAAYSPTPKLDRPVINFGVTPDPRGVDNFHTPMECVPHQLVHPR